MKYRDNFNPDSWFGLLNLLMYGPNPYHSTSMRLGNTPQRYLVQEARKDFRFDRRLLPVSVAPQDEYYLAQMLTRFYPPVSSKIVRRLLRRGLLTAQGDRVEMTSLGVRIWAAERKANQDLDRYQRYTTRRHGSTLSRYRRLRLRRGAGTAAALTRLYVNEPHWQWYRKTVSDPANEDEKTPHSPWRRHGWLALRQRRREALREKSQNWDEVETWTTNH